MKTFANIHISAKMTLAGIATIIAMSAVAAPANAFTYFSWTGFPGYLAYERTPAQCFWPPLASAEMYTDSPVVAPSPSYGLPQTIERLTWIETSVDNGTTWTPWKPLTTQSITLNQPGYGAVFSPQTVDLWTGFSYRIAERFNFKVGNSSVGTIWYHLDRADYQISLNVWGHRDPTPTKVAAGCTITGA